MNSKICFSPLLLNMSRKTKKHYPKKNIPNLHKPKKTIFQKNKIIWMMNEEELIYCESVMEH